MIPRLNDIIGLPAAAPPTEVAHAADRHCDALFGRASGGDPRAQRELVELQVAYLTWAYANSKSQQPTERRRIP